MDVAWTETKKLAGNPYIEAMGLVTIGAHASFKNWVWGFAPTDKWRRRLGLALPPLLLVAAIRSAAVVWEESAHTKKADSLNPPLS